MYDNDETMDGLVANLAWGKREHNLATRFFKSTLLSKVTTNIAIFIKLHQGKFHF